MPSWTASPAIRLTTAKASSAVIPACFASLSARSSAAACQFLVFIKVSPVFTTQSPCGENSPAICLLTPAAVERIWRLRPKAPRLPGSTTPASSRTFPANSTKSSALCTCSMPSWTASPAIRLTTAKASSAVIPACFASLSARSSAAACQFLVFIKVSPVFTTQSPCGENSPAICLLTPAAVERIWRLRP